MIEQTRMESVLKAQETSLADCTDEACAVEIGKLLAAEQIVLGTAGKIGQRYYLAVKLIDVAHGTNISADDQQKPSLDEIVDGLATLASRLAGTTPKVGRSAALVEMVLVEGGIFQMGDTFGDGAADERPVHTATVSSFQMAKYEVTFEEYDQFCDESGRSKPEDQGWGRGKQPVIDVSWFDAVEYCNWLSRKAALVVFYTVDEPIMSMNWSANGYRLPTEAEWEYAAKGGNRSRGYELVGGNDASRVGWYADNSRGRTHPVGSKAPNELGLFDMAGNVWEWCNDWYVDRYIPASGGSDPRGPPAGKYRVLRGGSWFNIAYNVRAAIRVYGEPADADIYSGFRLVRRPG